MAVCLAISIIVTHATIKMGLTHDSWHNGANTGNTQHVDIKKGKQWFIIVSLWNTSIWKDALFSVKTSVTSLVWHQGFWYRSLTAFMLNQCRFFTSSIIPSLILPLPPHLVSFQNTSLVLHKKNRKREKKRGEHIIFIPRYLTSLWKKKRNFPVVWDNETQKGNGDGDTCLSVYLCICLYNHT